ncbi:MAG: hypothetical protein Q9167_000469 [Letrouitia subvulpina]
MSNPCKSREDDDTIPYANGRSSIRLRRGRLVALRTKDEVKASASEQTVPAYIVRIPQKSANEVLKYVAIVLKSSPFPSFRPAERWDVRARAVDSVVRSARHLQHLRRLVKPLDLPAYLPHGDAIDCLEGDGTGTTQGEENILNPHHNAVRRDSLSLYLLICYSSVLPLSTVTSALAALPAFLPPNPAPDVLTVPVPLNPPCSESQAQKWTSEYWPTMYKRHNPFGPQPSAVAKAESEIYPSAGRWMALASQAAEEAWEAGIGEKVGAVVVDRKSEQGPQAVAVAGDGRWNGKFGAERGAVEERGVGGNAMAHAVMRAIGMVARRRKDVAARSSRVPKQSSPPLASDEPQAAGLTATEREHMKPVEGEGSHFADQPLTPLEHHIYNLDDTIPPNGYLCLDLEIYITHEPCVMCSMAILHSRFGKVVFGVPMPQTGGMAAEALRPDGSNTGEIEEEGTDGKGDDDGKSWEAELPEKRPYYGLFWRRELHWRLLAWRWLDDEQQEEEQRGTKVAWDLHF